MLYPSGDSRQELVSDKEVGGGIPSGAFLLETDSGVLDDDDESRSRLWGPELLAGLLSKKVAAGEEV